MRDVSRVEDVIGCASWINYGYSWPRPHEWSEYRHQTLDVQQRSNLRRPVTRSKKSLERKCCPDVIYGTKISAHVRDVSQESLDVGSGGISKLLVRPPYVRWWRKKMIVHKKIHRGIVTTAVQKKWFKPRGIFYWRLEKMAASNCSFPAFNR